MKPTFSDWLLERLGTRNWVVARRSPNILRRYGEDVLCLSSKRFEALEKEYEAAYGPAYGRRGA